MIFLWRALVAASAGERRLKRDVSENRAWPRPGAWALVWRQGGRPISGRRPCTKIERASFRWPLVPAHGDLIPSNVILSPDGPRTIDREYALFEVRGLVLDEAQLSCCLVAYPAIAAHHYRWDEVGAPAGRSHASNMLTYQWGRVEPLLTALHPAVPG